MEGGSRSRTAIFFRRGSFFCVMAPTLKCWCAGDPLGAGLGLGAALGFGAGAGLGAALGAALGSGAEMARCSTESKAP